MADFVRQRGFSLGLVVLVMAVVALVQSSITYTFAFGELRGPLGLLTTLAKFIYFMRWSLVAVMAALWLLKKKRVLFVLVMIVNAVSTLVLLVDTGSLTSELTGLSARTVKELLLDAALMGVSNILVFSVWYWAIDPPGIDKEQRTSEQWAFLFPQRAVSVPTFEGWQPGYADYLFVAFTTSFAFSPADALPLTRTAKMLMLLQATISVITLTGIAGSAISILAGMSGR